MEFIRMKIMKRLVSRRRKAQLWHCNITKVIYKKMDENLQKGRRLLLLQASETLFEIHDKQRTYIVDLQKKECSCGLWAVSGFPCEHAMPCINCNKLR